MNFIENINTNYMSFVRNVVAQGKKKIEEVKRLTKLGSTSLSLEKWDMMLIV